MDKKQYVVPRSIQSKLTLEVILHSVSFTSVKTNMRDLNSNDVNVQGIGFDNEATGTVSFSKGRGFYDDDYDY